jgi:hypothetical protein
MEKNNHPFLCNHYDPTFFSTLDHLHIPHPLTIENHWLRAYLYLDPYFHVSVLGKIPVVFGIMSISRLILPLYNLYNCKF